MATKKTAKTEEPARRVVLSKDGYRPAETDLARVTWVSVVVVDGVDGLKHYAWRRDGQRPVINEDDFARNRHSALAGELPADFADTVGPQ